MRACIFCLLVLSLCGCTGTGYTVTGTGCMLPGDTVFLFGSDGTALGSSPIAADTTFSIEGRCDKPDLVRLCDREWTCRPIRLLLEPGTIRIAAGAGGFEVSGTPLNDSLQRIAHRLDSLQDEWAARPSDAAERMQRRQLRDSMLCAAIRPHRGDLLGAYLCSVRFASDYPDDSTRLAALRTQLELFPAALQAHPLLQKLRARADAAENTRIGRPSMELALPDIDGHIRPLSPLIGRGRRVLVEFRTSWCRTCMQELSRLEALYDSCGGPGFEIYTVWLDNDPHAWENTVRRRNLPWTNVRGVGSDKGSDAAERYGIVDLPANFLISPSGEIEARNLHITQLEEILGCRAGKISE